MAAERTTDFGGKLREARERRGISLKQIASATKISVAVLEALERNDISRLPGGIFSRAFVRSYAVEVGLDPEATIQDFIQQFPHGAVTAGHPASDPVEDHQAVESDRRAASTFLRMIILSVPVVALVIYLTTSGTDFLHLLSGPFTHEPAPPESQAPSAEARAEPSLPPPSSPTPPAATPPPAGAEPMAARSPAAPRAATDSPAASTPAATPDGDQLAVGIAVSKPCWVSATVDGQKIIERLLAPGDTQTIAVKREMVLTAGDASAITMTINGAATKPFGRPGQVVTRRVNRANFKDYIEAR